MKTYYIGIFSDQMKGGEYSAFITKHQDNIPASAKNLRAIDAENKEHALLQYIEKSDASGLRRVLKNLVEQVQRDCSIGSDTKYLKLCELCQEAMQALKKTQP